MNTKELFGKEVLDANANSVGKVADIDFDIQKGTLNHIVVKAGLTKRYAIALDKIDKIGDKVILRIGRSDLEKKP
ncbi:MAG: PRC-barrel domain-containing protein [Dehalococcoidia bacterium]|nr:PRC-barrel domain-containing protein [Dehalococcoidia bacterium]